MINLRKLAQAVKAWGNCNQFFPPEDTNQEYVLVGHIDEDGNKYPLLEVDAAQYDSEDSMRLAEFYAAVSPSAIIELLDRLEAAELKAARYDWLRTGLAGDQCNLTDEESKVFQTFKAFEDTPTLEEFDAAIDGAITAELAKVQL